MPSLETHTGEVRYRVMLVRRLSSEEIHRCKRVVGAHLPTFRFVGEEQEKQVAELRHYDGARSLARAQVSAQGLALETQVDRKGGVPYTSWREWLSHLVNAAKELGWEPSDLQFSAVINDLLFKPPQVNCYEWLLDELVPGSELRRMAGDADIADSKIQLKLRRNREVGKLLMLEVDSNQGELEINAGDFTDEETRAWISCHHVVTDIRATSWDGDANDLADVLQRQETELSHWVANEILPQVERLARKGQESNPEESGQ